MVLQIWLALWLLDTAWVQRLPVSLVLGFALSEAALRSLHRLLGPGEVYALHQLRRLSHTREATGL